MIRAGLIWNRRSHRNQGRFRAPLPPGVLDIEPAETSELFAALRRFAAEGVELVVIDGGDGTIREVLTRLPEAYGGRFPRLAVVPSGKTNALALDIGTPLGTTLEQLLDAAETGRPTKRRRCLEITRPGQALPEARGFLFGFGAFVRATRLAQTHHGLGLFDNAAIAVTLAGVTFGTFFGGPNDPWRRGEMASVGGAEPRAWFVVLASALKRLPLGVKPFGEPREGLKVLAVEAPPRRLAQALPIVLRGADAPWLAGAGYLRQDPGVLTLDLPGEFVLDGEIFEGGEFAVREGPVLELVVP